MESDLVQKEIGVIVRQRKRYVESAAKVKRKSEYFGGGRMTRENNFGKIRTC